ncbi:unnamed protein product [Mesocestoides corti]|uniref:DUF3402 domain-containing protein n=1 Tax=Mesocestoides corti TaxID=53468 RepID=A0A0R3UD88_MESCO|nr:unnamed protein product [Mesocestoides corti]
MSERKLLRRLVRTGRRKLVHLEKNSPGKLLNRHLLCQSLKKWRLLRKELRNEWKCEWEDRRTCVSAWDEEDDYDSLESLHVFPPDPKEIDPSSLLALAYDVDYYSPSCNFHSPYRIRES